MSFTRQYSEAQVAEIAQQLIRDFPTHRIFLFSGELGTGKTTLIKAICAELGVEKGMSSPSFGLVNAYMSGSGDLYHFDLYRLNEIHEFLDIGIEEYLDSGSYCFLEWPEIGLDIFRSYPHVSVQLEQLKDGTRRIFAEG